MPRSLPRRRGNGGGHVQSKHIVKNRVLRQLSADELKSIQPWLSPIELRPNNVLQEQGAAIGLIYFPLSGMISAMKGVRNDRRARSSSAARLKPDRMLERCF